MIHIFKISEMLSKVFVKKKDTDDDYLTIHEIMQLLHERGFGIMIILFSLPNLFPGFVPPIPTLFAIPICIFSVQMIMRMDAPYLPHFISKRKLKRSSLQNAINKSLPYMTKVETVIRPRVEYMTTETVQRYLGILALIFALTVALPIPMTNFMPSVALLIMGIGLVSRDGLAVIIGSVIGILWIILLFFISNKLIEYFA
jgi:hypothetical protein